MFWTTFVAVPPPGSCQTATAIRIRIAKLRMCVLRSGPTAPNDSPPRRSGGDDVALGDRDRGHRSRSRSRVARPGAPGAAGDLDGRRIRHGIHRLGREPVPDPEVRVDVAPP